MNASRRCCEALRGGWLEGRSGLAHWHCMLLANLSTGEAGQKALCAEEGHLKFLHAAYVSKTRPEPRDGYDDPMLCLGKVINNTCAQLEGRKIFSGGENGAAIVQSLAEQLNDRQRRPDMVSTFRNLCLDEECHVAIVATDLLMRLARFLYPWEKVAPAKRANLPEPLQEVLQADGATMTGDVSVRHAAAQSVLGLCLSKAGRTYLREWGAYELVRAWHDEEADDQIKTALETVVPSVQLSEEELAVNKPPEELVSPETAKRNDASGYSGASEQPPTAEEK